MSNSVEKTAREEIAIIGMAGRFPGARKISEFWKNLCDGLESVRSFSEQELASCGVDPAVLSDPNYVNAGAVMDDAEWFASSFFGYSPREAELMDPQHRILLECAWEALESAGCDPYRYGGLISVYAGIALNSYFQNNLSGRPEIARMLGQYQLTLGNEKDFVATRVAYKLNLKGPSFTVQTGCSTSLVAVHLACQSLLNGESDMAVVGGGRVRVPLKAGYFYVEGSIPSPDGHCRAFDAGANGCIVGSGIATVVLKRISDAVRDGDVIHAVIKGSAINNDGNDKIGFTAPSVTGQAAVIGQALAMADVSADTIGYVEAHGTGTSLGDPIEIAALTKAFREHTANCGYCAIGSVKTNIGHLDAGAGVAGLIKAALALRHGAIPPSLNFNSPNPQIDFANSPFFVNTQLTSWKRVKSPRRAGVSSFGIGGTNAHVIVEEAPEAPTSPAATAHQLLVVSAKTAPALDQATAKLAAHLRAQPAENLADVAYTLQIGRAAFTHRRCIVAGSPEEAAQALEAADSRRVFTGAVAQQDPPIVFMFPGQGAQYLNMGADIYRTEPVFREVVDRCATILQPLLGLDLRSVLFAGQGDAAKEQLHQTRITQPALFTVEYALAQLLQSWGIKPAAMIGHSVGEYVAGCVAGVFTLEDALMLIARRAQLVQAQPAGTMLAVRLPETEVRPLLSEKLDIAAINAPRLCVVAGPHDAVAALEKILDARGTAHKRLHTSHAFHSSMMDPVLPPFTELLRRTRLAPPQIPYVSNVTTRWITPGEATNAEYWAQHVRQTVRFADGLAELFRGPRSILLEVGPGRTLTQLARQHPSGGSGQTTVVTLGDARDEECTNLRAGLGRLWLAGINPDWCAVHGAAPRRRVVLPTYPFERQRHWIDPMAATSIASPPPTSIVPSATVPALAVEPIRPLRRRHLINELKGILHELSGIELVAMKEEATFLELGFESLFLTQANAAFQRKFGVRTTFRQLIEQTPTIASLAAFIDEQLPPEVAATVTAVASVPPPPSSRRPRFIAEIKQLLHELSGIELVAMNEEATFLELGFESLFLTQANAAFQRKFGVRTTFRQLLEQTPTIASLAAFIDEQIPREIAAPPALPPPIATSPVSATVALRVDGEITQAAGSSSMLELIGRQLASLTAQVEVLRRQQAPTTSLSSVPTIPANLAAPEVAAGLAHAGNGVGPAAIAPTTATIGPWRPLEKGRAASGLTPTQRRHLDALIARYCAKTAGSKALTAAQRKHVADPRSVSGFRQIWKEMVYQIAVTRSLGTRLWDVDGNEYIDVTMGFSVNLFGFSPPFVVRAIEAQLHQGMEIGVLAPLTKPVAEGICRLTGADRACFLNTGSEANMAALRAARTVTGRERIAVFAGSYHGIFDEVLVKPVTVNGERRSLPVSPGIPASMFQHVTVLNYGDPASIDLLRREGHEIAAVFVEPVQTRHPDLQPREFLHALREVTQHTGTALIFDEVVTGFRLHPRGAQGYFGVQADLASYGKLIGGGMPIAVVAGKSRFMDAFDGGQWNYGDDSFPEVGVTFFGGTFVKHPLALAASAAVVSQLESEGPQLQERLNRRAANFAAEMNSFFQAGRLPLHLERGGSIFSLTFPGAEEHARLLFFHLRERGVHIYDRPFSISTAHTDEDLAAIISAMKESVAELQAGGFLPQGGPTPLQALRLSGGYVVTPAGSNGAGRSDEHTLTTDRKPTVAATRNDIVALTHAQMEVWLGCQFGAVASTVFNETSVIALQGEIDLKALRQAAQQVVDRHEALRTTFLPDGSGQIVASTLTVEVPLVDLAALEPTARATRRAELLAAEGDEPFDLQEGPLVRFQVWRHGPNDHELVVSCHHLICDGVSFGVFLRDLSAFYEAAYSGGVPRLTAGGQFRDYVKWEQTGTLPSDDAANEAYWLRQFADGVPVLDLPADQRRPAQMHFSGDLESTMLTGSLVRDLRRLSATTGNTLYCVLLSAFHALLHRLSGQDDIVIGTAVSGQSLMGEPNIVGHCVNFLPLRIRSSGTSSIRDHLQATRNVILDAFDHANFTYGRLVRQLKMPRDPARLPLLGVSFNLDPKPHLLRFGAIETWDRGAPKRHVNLDLEFNLVELEDGLRLDCRYLRDVYSGETIHRWLGYYANLLVAYVKDSERAVDDLPLVSEAERQRVLVEWNATTADYPRDACVHQLFAAQAAQTPERVAVVCGGEQITYHELNARANQLAHHLRAHGVGPDVTVGVCIERSVNLVVALLGVWKAGGAYIPIDPGYPPDRVAFVLGDAGATMLLTEQALARRPGLADIATVLCLDQDGIKIARESTAEPDVAVESKHLAYVIYTSGSTGRPKGVQIEHRAVVNFLRAMRKVLGLCKDDVMLAVTTISFDIAGLELFLPLTTGARVMLAPRETAVDGRALSNAIDTNGVTIMQATPTTWRIMLEAGWTGSLRLKILCGGEALPPELARELLPRCAELWNMYGPTETTIWSTCCRVSSAEDIHIGRPIANTEVFVVDAGFRPVPIGVRGELLIGGDGLARGYWQRPELTAEKFIAHPFRPGARLYRTGDVARYRLDGNIECLGRVDFQVKIRGFRIELGEIEAMLEQETDVRQAVVTAREFAADDRRLVAYVVPTPGRNLETTHARESLRRHLPDYMVPQHFVVLDKLPSTPNGKIDRKALPMPALAGVATNATTTTGAERSAWVAQEEACHSRIAPRTLRDFSDFETRMNSLCTAYAVRHLVSAGVTMRAGMSLSRQTVKAKLRVLPALDRYVDYLLNTLVEDGVFVADGGDLRCMHGADEFPAPDEALCDLQRAHPEFGGVMQMLAHCFAHLADALSGTIPAISVLFPDGRRDFLDRLLFRETIEHTNIRVYEELARDYVVARARQRPTRILEVGGGTGMLTWRLLPELKGLQAEYVFTDIGMTFIAEARKKTDALGLDFVECRKFDVTRAGTDQGLAEGSFDLILGLNVVHATPNLSAVIGHLTRLLKSDGALCLVEYVRSPRWQNLIWGLTEGWWCFRDTWRKSVPLISLNQWEQVLREGGLSAWALPVDPERRKSTDAGMLVATWASAVEQSEVAPTEAPRTAVEKQLHSFWEQVLKRSPIGIRDNFFDLGGHSLLAVKLFAEIEHKMGRKLPLATLFSAPTIERLAREFDTTKASAQEWASLVAIQPHGTKPALYCVHGAGGNILLYRDLVEKLGLDYPVYGFQSRGLDGRSRPLVSVEDMAAEYLTELKSVQASGPYCLAGYCLGGLVAYQMARMLREAGDEVAFVALFDTYNPTEVGQTSRMGVLLQRAKFHASNLARLRPRELGRYLQEKFRVARDGELFNLLASGSESNNGGQASAPQFNEDPGGDAGVQRVNDRAAEAFRPLPYDGSIMLFKPQVNYDFFPDPEMGWGNMACGGLEVVELPVNPHAMLVKPFVEHLAVAIAKRLDKAGIE